MNEHVAINGSDVPPNPVGALGGSPLVLMRPAMRRDENVAGLGRVDAKRTGRPLSVVVFGLSLDALTLCTQLPNRRAGRNERAGNRRFAGPIPTGMLNALGGGKPHGNRTAADDQQSGNELRQSGGAVTPRGPLGKILGTDPSKHVTAVRGIAWATRHSPGHGAATRKMNTVSFKRGRDRSSIIGNRGALAPLEVRNRRGGHARFLRKLSLSPSEQCASRFDLSSGGGGHILHMASYKKYDPIEQG